VKLKLKEAIMNVQLEQALYYQFLNQIIGRWNQNEKIFI